MPEEKHNLFRLETDLVYVAIGYTEALLYLRLIIRRVVLLIRALDEKIAYNSVCYSLVFIPIPLRGKTALARTVSTFRNNYLA